MSRYSLFLTASAIAVASLSNVPSAFAQVDQGTGDESLRVQAGTDTLTEDQKTLDRVVVTGVFGATSIEKAPISITVLSGEALEQLAPVSSADVLKSVPGVFVNSSLGEIRNIVFSRGVSARSLEAAGGYFYVSLQEDGLPVEPITASNFGPDYFSRYDVMTERVEALRGGTAVVTGANAPGGIFNYISKTGKSAPGTEVQVKLGLEGDGDNPYYRIDGYSGGRIGGSNLYYAIGGFYRQSDGARYPGYRLNSGGQVRGNVLWDYDGGSLKVSAKYLDDNNGWFETIPAKNFDDPQIIAPFTNKSSVLPPPSPHSYVDLASGQQRTWDGTDLINQKGLALDVDWQHTLNDRFTIENKLRFSNNKAHWNTTAVTFPAPLTDDDIGIRLIQGTIGIDGTYTYRTPDGALAAVIEQVGGTRTLTVNNLPNPNVLEGGVLTALAYQPDMQSETFQNQFTLSGDFGAHQFSLGAYVSTSSYDTLFSGAGGGVMTLESQPSLLSTTLTLDDGSTYLVTDSSGWAGIGTGIAIRSNGTDMTGFSIFAGDTWQATDKLSIDAALRYENLEYDSYNYLTVPFTGDRLATGGRDGNPITLYDNGTITLGEKLPYVREYDYLAFSGSAAYEFSDAFQAYIRYTDGKKAPDFNILGTITSQSAIDTVFPTEETIKQVEMGLKYRRPGVFVQVFPFWSENGQVADNQVFTYRSGPNVGVSYSPPPVYGTIETYGVEVSGDFEISDQLNFHADLTLQDPQASGFSTYAQGPLGDGTDDIVSTVASGDADNNPKIIARATATYRPVDTVSLFATYSYLGERAANRRNAWYLPGFSTVDAGASWDVNNTTTLQFNVTNVFDEQGVMGWAKGGSFLNALDRQALTREQVAADPDQLFSVLPNQPRAFYLSAKVKF